MLARQPQQLRLAQIAVQIVGDILRHGRLVIDAKLFLQLRRTTQHRAGGQRGGSHENDKQTGGKTRHGTALHIEAWPDDAALRVNKHLSIFLEGEIKRCPRLRTCRPQGIVNP